MMVSSSYLYYILPNPKLHHILNDELRAELNTYINTDWYQIGT